MPGRLPEVVLKKGEEARIVAGHPWVFEGAIAKVDAGLQDGAAVFVKDHRGRFLGTGLYNSKSKIVLRMLSHEREEIDEAFFERKIKAALAIRQRYMPGAMCYRVVNSEGDFLSGLIVDKYGDVLVVQFTSLGMDQRREIILNVLKRLFSPRAIVERSDVTARKFENLPERAGVLYGQLFEPLVVEINNIKFEVDFITGHKTGLYLDQQLNYLEVARYASGANVLDCFSFVGGFALHCAKAGAASVLMVEQREEAANAAMQNAKLNGVENVCSVAVANVFDWLRERTSTDAHSTVLPVFDLIILDPPSFTRTRERVINALRGYKEIHIRALKLLKPGGILATFCCSHHVDRQMFLDAILAAAYDTRHILRRVAMLSQAPDHPVIPMIPETEYLKGFIFELAR
jgi:23S rRNA (cytosine1962-C5)-methyltransferase